MPTDMRHEEMRWSYMTREQLEARLKKITVGEKLSNYIELAYRGGERYLLQAALIRARDLGYNVLVGRAQDYLREMERTTELRSREVVGQHAPKPSPQVTDPKPKREPVPEVRKIRFNKKKK